MLKVLYDGWALARRPNSPEALHLAELLTCCPSGVEALVGLPAAPFFPLPPGVTACFAATPAGARLQWEQRSLPGLVRRFRPDLLHLTGANPPLFGPGVSVISPAGPGSLSVLGSADADMGEPPPRPYLHLGDRLRHALAAGGMVRARGLLWPADLPAPDPAPRLPLLRLQPVVHPAFTANSPAALTVAGLELPESWVLYHGPTGLPALRRLLAAWSWAAGPVGEYHPLLLVGLDEPARQALPGLLAEYGVENTVQVLPLLSFEAMAAVYRGCSALFHPAPPAAWGSPLRLALACGRPVVALETPLTAALVGPAAYLAPAADFRGLGAALITVLVEESVAEGLAQAALQRAAAWTPAAFCPALLEAYRSLLTPHPAPGEQRQAEPGQQEHAADDPEQG